MKKGDTDKNNRAIRISAIMTGLAVYWHHYFTAAQPTQSNPHSSSSEHPNTDHHSSEQEKPLMEESTELHTTHNDADIQKTITTHTQLSDISSNLNFDDSPDTTLYMSHTVTIATTEHSIKDSIDDDHNGNSNWIYFSLLGIGTIGLIFASKSSKGGSTKTSDELSTNLGSETNLDVLSDTAVSTANNALKKDYQKATSDLFNTLHTESATVLVTTNAISQDFDPIKSDDYKNTILKDTFNDISQKIETDNNQAQYQFAYPLQAEHTTFDKWSINPLPIEYICAEGFDTPVNEDLWPGDEAITMCLVWVPTGTTTPDTPSHLGIFTKELKAYGYVMAHNKEDGNAYGCGDDPHPSVTHCIGDTTIPDGGCPSVACPFPANLYANNIVADIQWRYEYGECDSKRPVCNDDMVTLSQYGIGPEPSGPMKLSEQNINTNNLFEDLSNTIANKTVAIVEENGIVEAATFTFVPNVAQACKEDYCTQSVQFQEGYTTAGVLLYLFHTSLGHLLSDFTDLSKPVKTIDFNDLKGQIDTINHYDHEKIENTINDIQSNLNPESCNLQSTHKNTACNAEFISTITTNKDVISQQTSTISTQKNELEYSNSNTNWKEIQTNTNNINSIIQSLNEAFAQSNDNATLNTHAILDTIKSIENNYHTADDQQGDLITYKDLLLPIQQECNNDQSCTHHEIIEQIDQSVCHYINGFNEIYQPGAAQTSDNTRCTVSELQNDSLNEFNQTIKILIETESFESDE